MEIAKLTPFPGHPFRLCTGERLEKMTESIREHGVLEPVLVVAETGKRVTEHQAKQLREQADALDEAAIWAILCGGTAEGSKPYSLTVSRAVITQYFPQKTKKKEIAETVEKALAMYFAGQTEAI